MRSIIQKFTVGSKLGLFAFTARAYSYATDTPREQVPAEEGRADVIWLEDRFVEGCQRAGHRNFVIGHNQNALAVLCGELGERIFQVLIIRFTSFQ